MAQSRRLLKHGQIEQSVAILHLVQNMVLLGQFETYISRSLITKWNQEIELPLSYGNNCQWWKVPSYHFIKKALGHVLNCPSDTTGRLSIQCL